MGRAVCLGSALTARPCGDDGFLEDYIAQVRGEPIACLNVVSRNAAGDTQHIAAN